MPPSSRSLLFVCAVLVGESVASPPEARAEDPKDARLGHQYERKDGHIYYRGERIDQAGKHDIDRFAQAVGRPLTLCDNVDAATFVALSHTYSKDKNCVYYRWISPGRFWIVKLSDADPETFVTLDSSLAKDRRSVWRGDCVVPEADAATAEVVRPLFVWRDRHSVYYQSKIIAGADPATFRHIAQAFYRDAHQVWWSTHLLTEADPESFEAFGDDVPYARDRNHVWSGYRILEEVDAQSLELVYKHVYKDAQRVYVGTRANVILGADPATFFKVGKIAAGPEMLFRDVSRHYVLETGWLDVYALQVQGESILISKPLWLSADGTKEKVYAGTASAELRNGLLHKLRVTVEPGFKADVSPLSEKMKFVELKDVFLEVQEGDRLTWLTSGRRRA